MSGLTEVTNRTLPYVGLGAAAVMLGLQAVIFALWGNDGDPPDAIVVIGTVLFWAAVLVALTVIVLAVRRRLSSRHR